MLEAMEQLIHRVCPGSDWCYDLYMLHRRVCRLLTIIRGMLYVDSCCIGLILLVDLCKPYKHYQAGR